jgi:deoxyribonuclease-4
VRLGAHVSAAGGIDKAIERATAIGAYAIQIFGSPPQSLIPPKHTPEAIASFKSKAEAAGIGPVFLHAPYLINLASPRPHHVAVSVDSLVAALNLAGDLGAVGVIFHTGSTLGAGFEEVAPRVVAALTEVLDRTPSSTKLIMENSAGAGGTVGDTPLEIGYFMKEVGSRRLATCLDTQHAFASGYDLTTDLGIGTMIADWDREIGLDRLVAIHANDSKVPQGSNKDRHENIGEGFIGRTGFKLLKKNEILAKLPWIIEVPGFAGNGPDKENLELLKSL